MDDREADFDVFQGRVNADGRKGQPFSTLASRAGSAAGGRVVQDAEAPDTDGCEKKTGADDGR